ncbi:RpiB/LacA/LacB family sugar-phosphate isomerase [Methylocapsa palsarum]|uniref:Ribose 5-phosphate isomerase B n=1 Tax=Methylocapsa palsarum TaxID=1612308 RepID=A0A1I4B7P1_9HYPH|nr:ribose 5-phosphate isomerase B [Methylocapsa palsarum]
MIWSIGTGTLRTQKEAEKVEAQSRNRLIAHLGSRKAAVRIGIASDHGGFVLKCEMAASLESAGYEVVDFGAHQLNPEDDYPDYIIPLARAVAAGQLERGVALCGSGVGASIAANKIPGVRAGLIHDVFSAHQGVEDDDMNVFCLGGQVVGTALALELIETFLSAHFSGAPRHRRRLAKVQALETILPRGFLETLRQRAQNP